MLWLACLVEQGVGAPRDIVVCRKGAHALSVVEGVGLLKGCGVVVVDGVQHPHEQHSSDAGQEGQDEADAAQPSQRRAARNRGIVQSQERRDCSSVTINI